jgi:hypothetical protein
VLLVDDILAGLLQMRAGPPVSCRHIYASAMVRPAIILVSLSVSQKEVSFGVGFRMKFCRLCVGSLFPKGCRIMHKPDSSLKLIVLSEELK